MEFLGLFTSGIWYAVFFVLTLSIIVAIHEYGHYIVGRWTGIEADVFSLGFGPVIFSRRDKRGMLWQVAAIPFGGYVKFKGDADASSVRGQNLPEGLSAQERRKTFGGAPLWARALTVLAGPFANFFLTGAVLTALLAYNGIMTDTPTVARLLPLPQEQSLREGDVIIAMNGRQTPDARSFGEVLSNLPEQERVEYTVLRDGQPVVLQAPHPQPAVIMTVQPKSAAVDAGLRAGDVITEARGRQIATFGQLQDVVFSSQGEPIPLKVWRNGQSFDLTLTPRPRDIPDQNGEGFKQQWMIGISSGMAFDMATRSPSALELVTRPAQQMWGMVEMTFSGLYHMIAGQISTCGMSGMVGIAETMGDAAKAGPMDFISMIAILSLGIGIMNLFPVPVLDGGHLVFFAYEAVTGKPPSERVMGLLMPIGLSILLSLMAFSLWQDFTCV